MDENFSSSISDKDNEKILFQMKNCVCKIIAEDGKKGTGFFYKIKVNQKKDFLPVLVTNNHVLDYEDLNINKSISLVFNDEKEIRKIKLDKKRKVFTNKAFDISFIEIIPEDKIDNYLEIDDEIIEQEKSISETKYNDHPIYLLHYQENDGVKVSYGQILSTNGPIIDYLCDVENGLSGAPILSLKSYQVIGIYYGRIKDRNNIGTLIKYPIDKFKESLSRKSISTIIFEVKKFDISVIFQNHHNRNIFGHTFVKNNKNNCKVIINSSEYPLQEFYDLNCFLSEKEWEEWDNYDEIKRFELTLIEINNVKDMSYMFSNCGFNTCNNQVYFSEWDISNVSNLTNIFSGYIGNITNISDWDTSNVNDMSHMFNGYWGNIPDISKWDTSNVSNMSYMFNGYQSELPDISKWNISNVKDLSGMFCKCQTKIPDISKWDTSNVISMNGIFCGCQSKLPDISNWNISNVKYMNSLFSECQTELPDISKWDTSNVINMCNVFSGNINLKVLPDISKWKTYNLETISGIFCDCNSLESLPDISKWDTSNITILNWVFKGCYSLRYLPDISKWDASSAIYMDSLFENCHSLVSFPDISKWNVSNVNYINKFFSGCQSLQYLPDISNWNTSNIIDMSGVFKDCKLLKELPDISKWYTSNVTNMSFLFSGCQALLSLPNISN